MTTPDRMSVPEAREALEKAGYDTEKMREGRRMVVNVYSLGFMTFIAELPIRLSTVSRASVNELVEREK